MKNQESRRILLLSKENCIDIPQTLCTFTLDVTQVHNFEEFAGIPLSDMPDLILVHHQFSALQAGELIIQVRKKWDQMPVIMILASPSLKIIGEIFTAGVYDFIREEYFQEDLLANILKCSAYIAEKEEQKRLVKDLNNLTAYLQEKNEVFKTVMELITHDTKNNFYYITTAINQIQDKSLKENLENTVHDLNELIMQVYGYLNGKKRIRNCVTMLENLHVGKERIKLKEHPKIQFTHTTSYLLFIEVSALFKNAISNIIENALQYSPDQSEVKVDLYREKEYINIKITDRGTGISNEDKNLIFGGNNKVRWDIALEGTGKGLWITRIIIEKEKGTVTVADNPGGGTIFLVKVPVFKIDDFQKGLDHLSEWFDVPPLVIKHKKEVLSTFLDFQKFEPVEDMESVLFANLVLNLRDEAWAKNKKHFYRKLSEIKSLNPDGKSVLIIDNSLHVHYYLATHFTKIGYRIAGFARNGADGVSFYQILKPHLVTMDFTMPMMSGTEAAIEIVKMDKQAKILFITGVGEHPKFIETLRKSIPRENYRIIKKPFKREILESIIRDFCQ